MTGVAFMAKLLGAFCAVIGGMICAFAAYYFVSTEPATVSDTGTGLLMLIAGGIFTVGLTLMAVGVVAYVVGDMAEGAASSH